MKFIIYLLLLFSTVSCTQYELLDYNPVANQKAVIISGNARFTVLTPYVIRMEYAKTKSWENRATIAFVNRYLPVPQFTVSNTSSTLTITTSELALTYSVGQEFSATTLTIKSNNPSSAFSNWHYGQENSGNLLGTIRSLDEVGVIPLNCTLVKNKKVHGEGLHCAWGLISKEGWSVVDDSDNWAVNSEYWWDEVNTDTIDNYFFGHGHNFKLALSDFTQIAGKIAMVPRYIGGIMWSRWYNYNNYGVRGVVDDYISRDIPLDVYILDMDWHFKYNWGAYTFDYRLFPYPEETMEYLHELGLHTSVNIHDDNGVITEEKMYKEMAQALGLNPSTAGNIPFSIVNQTYMYSLDDIVLGDVNQLGVDFWWIDWQQGGTQGGAKGGKQNPTIGLNMVRGTDNIRTGKNVRDVILSRWGGLGSHRYQIGFSGDVAQVTWQNLAFQPYFSSTATNVGFGFWSNDIVGPPNSQDHELQTRWIQWGAYSAAFRTHDRGMSAGTCANHDPSQCAIVEPWNVPQKYMVANRDCMRKRVELTPYIYNAYREAFVNGLSILRPMYYEYPDKTNAYLTSPDGSFAQYFFGPEIIAAPVVTQSNSTSEMTKKSVWLPAGTWFEESTGVLHTIKTDTYILTKSYDLDEVPIFIQGGAILPKIPLKTGETLARAQQQYTTLVFEVYPGQNEGKTVVYEDDALTMDYLKSAYMETTASYKRSANSFTLTVKSAGNGYPQFPKTRNYVLKVANHLPVSTGTVNGKAIVYDRFGKTFPSWRYEGDSVTTVIETGPITGSLSIAFSTLKTTSPSLMNGIKGKILKSNKSKQNMDKARATPGAHDVKASPIETSAATGKELQYLAGKDATKFTSVLENYPALFTAAYSQIQSLKLKDHDRWVHSMALLQNAAN